MATLGHYNECNTSFNFKSYYFLEKIFLTESNRDHISKK